MSNTDGAESGGDDHRDAVCPGDEKLQPDEVPVCEFEGVIRAPQTDQKLLLVFGTPDGGTVGIRLDEQEYEAMDRDVESLRVMSQ